jgi:hypothetical protein
VWVVSHGILFLFVKVFCIFFLLLLSSDLCSEGGVALWMHVDASSQSLIASKHEIDSRACLGANVEA